MIKKFGWLNNCGKNIFLTNASISYFTLITSSSVRDKLVDTMLLCILIFSKKKEPKRVYQHFHSSLEHSSHPLEKKDFRRRYITLFLKGFSLLYWS